jgi:hypothetical protein
MAFATVFAIGASEVSWFFFEQGFESSLLHVGRRSVACFIGKNFSYLALLHTCSHRQPIYQEKAGKRVYSE